MTEKITKNLSLLLKGIGFSVVSTTVRVRVPVDATRDEIGALFEALNERHDLGWTDEFGNRHYEVNVERADIECELEGDSPQFTFVRHDDGSLRLLG
jgi:hypothetical protein